MSTKCHWNTTHPSFIHQVKVNVESVLNEGQVLHSLGHIVQVLSPHIHSSRDGPSPMPSNPLQEIQPVTVERKPLVVHRANTAFLVDPHMKRKGLGVKF